MKETIAEARWKCVWTPDEDARLMTAIERGLTTSAISRLLRRSRQGVMRRRQAIAQKLTGYQPRRRWTPQEDAALIERLQAGDPPATIAAALGRTLSAVHTRTDLLRGHRPADLPPSRRAVALGRALPPLRQKKEAAINITAEDYAWMTYWRQPRAVRRAQGVSP